MGIYIIYSLMYNIKAACRRSSDTAEFPSGLHTTSSHLLLQLQLVYHLWQHIHVKAKFPSQDVVDGPGSGALRRAGLRVRAAGGEGGRVPQSRRPAAGVRRGQTVHDAGETLQTGGSGCLIGQTLYKEEDMISLQGSFQLIQCYM